jgi:hypothetical protein
MDAIWEFMRTIEETGFATWVREGDFFVSPFSAFYVILGVHSIGMVMVAGVMFILSLRLFGYFPQFPVSSTNQWMRIAWWGFYINAVSGLVLVIAQPRREFLTLTFDIKLLMIFLAVFTMVAMQRALANVEVVARPDGTAVEMVPPQARMMAFICNLLWLGAIISGRLIGYTQVPPPS